MTKILDKQRYKCAMSAMSTVQAIERAIPILHSGPGCAQKLSNSAGSSGFFSPNIFPCTSINEQDVVFGGEKKLHSTIEAALEIVDADLFVVLTGCTPEIVGDDVEEIVSDFQTAKKPVIFAPTPGFKGNTYKGHEWVVDAIVDQMLEAVPEEEKEAGLVNIWADVPYQDEFWLGNLRALESLIESIGLKPNTIFGFGRGIENIKKIPKAAFNLLVSPWVGLSNVKHMQDKFGTPYLHWPTLPIGAFETSRFLKAVAKQTLRPANLTKISAFAKIFQQYVKTDLELGELAWLGQEAFTVGADNIDFSTLPGEWKSPYIYLNADEVLNIVNEHLNPYVENRVLEDLGILT